MAVWILVVWSLVIIWMLGFDYWIFWEFYEGR
jgi:hypothetical protein